MRTALRHAAHADVTGSQQWQQQQCVCRLPAHCKVLWLLCRLATLRQAELLLRLLARIHDTCNRKAEPLACWFLASACLAKAAVGGLFVPSWLLPLRHGAVHLSVLSCTIMQERNDVLEKAFTEAQAQAVHHREQMSEMQASLKKATKVLQSFDKLQKTMTEQQQVTSQLMQERQLLQQQVQLLQVQSKEQADKLRRTQLQKQRLEGLCRTLQVS